MAKVEDCPGFETFGADVKAARKAKHLTRKVLAEIVGIEWRYQLIAHDNGKDRRCNGDDHRVRQGLQHIEYAAVPRLRRRPHIRGDFPDFRIDRAEQPGQVAHDAVD